MYNDVSSRAAGLKFGMKFDLHPNFVYVSREGCGESVHLHRLRQAGLNLHCLTINAIR